MKFAMPLTIFILVVTAGVLGYTIYNQSIKSAPSQQDPAISQAPQRSPTVNAPGATQSALPVNQIPPWFASLSAGLRNLYNTPKPDASAEERLNFSSLVRSNANNGTELVILKECQPNPIAFSLDKTASKITVKNTDTVTHTIILTEKERYPIGPGTSSIIPFEKKGVILSYGCDTYSTVGFLLAPSQ